MAATAATGSMAEVTVPSMLHGADSARYTGQILSNIGDKPNQPTFQSGSLAKQSQSLGACRQHGFENGHYCIMTKWRIIYFAIFVA